MKTMLVELKPTELMDLSVAIDVNMMHHNQDDIPTDSCLHRLRKLKRYFDRAVQQANEG